MVNIARTLTKYRWLSVVAPLLLGLVSAQGNLVLQQNVCGHHKSLNVSITCLSSAIVITGKKYIINEYRSGPLQGSKIFWNSRLYFSRIVNGAVTYIQTTLYDLRTGKKIFDQAADAVYFDENLMVLIDTSDFRQNYFKNPIIYIYRKNDNKIYTYRYHLSARPDCKLPDDDSDVTVSEFRVTPTQFIFHSEDKCGEFDIVEPFPKNSGVQ
ncbi:hypothetical protein Q0M94_04005 [Deinococcus radiomollis]|uniref:hypothetical protein n=1 Tax=Deinococcus radiomollis TaxID=468916 RepID=UPI0038929936